jgi:hypothetical protein
LCILKENVRFEIEKIAIFAPKIGEGCPECINKTVYLHGLGAKKKSVGWLLS